MQPKSCELYATLLPSMPHFKRFANDPRMKGLRLNTPMLSGEDLKAEFDLLAAEPPSAEVYFDVKGRQLRTLQSDHLEDHLELVINHPVSVSDGTLVLFKGGAEFAVLDHVTEEGYRLVFEGGPEHKVKPGESFHITDPSFKQGGELFNEWELKRIELAKQAGFNRWLLSYTESMRDVDQFQELVGQDAEIWLKIENQKGLQFVAREFRKRENLTLVAARGDLYVELIQRPHDILAALQLIRSNDAQAVAGSRILLSVVGSPVPSCADLSELGWLFEIGYRRFMLCDEMCLHEDMLALAVNVFWAVADAYPPTTRPSANVGSRWTRALRELGKTTDT